MAVLLTLAGCGYASADPSELTYLGQRQLINNLQFDGTTVGGLSAISYDPAAGRYYVISDDRSEHNPARFYTARIALSDNGVDDVQLKSTRPWLREDGTVFPGLDVAAQPVVIPPDPEGIAFDPRRQLLYWSSEGERDGAVLLDPWVRIATLDGQYVGEFVLPPGLQMSVDETGPRRNNALEGLTLSPDGSTLFAALEEPAYQDGALTRITALDVDTRLPVAQYAYVLDGPSAGPGASNGLSAMVALDTQSFLVVERGFGDHVAARIYRAETVGATDVLGSGVDGAVPMTKTLVSDLTTAVDPLDNVEGITLGPVLPDGRQSVVLVSDDNFNDQQVTQFLLLAM